MDSRVKLLDCKNIGLSLSVGVLLPELCMLEQEFLTCKQILLPDPNHKWTRLVINDVKKLNKGRHQAPETEGETVEDPKPKQKAKGNPRPKNSAAKPKKWKPDPML